MKDLPRNVLLLGAWLPVAVALAQGGDPDTGRQVYVAQMCNTCHTLAGESGPMAQIGGSLDGVGARRDAAWLRLYFTDPKAALPILKKR
jgi:cytochrome c2